MDHCSDKHQLAKYITKLNMSEMAELNQKYQIPWFTIYSREGDPQTPSPIFFIDFYFLRLAFFADFFDRF